jgi:hypothetical protein
MTLTLKEETILNEWTTLVDHAAGHSQELLDDVQRRLEEAQIPGDCSWDIREVKSSTWLDRVRRDFLIVSLEKFRDYHMYIGVRDYGVHLDCCRFLTVEPNIVKKLAGMKLMGDGRAPCRH